MEANEINRRVAEALGWEESLIEKPRLFYSLWPGVPVWKRADGTVAAVRGEFSPATNPHHALGALIEYTCSRFGVTQVYFTEGDFWYVGISQPDYEIAEGQGSYCAAICAAILAAAGGGE